MRPSPSLPVRGRRSAALVAALALAAGLASAPVAAAEPTATPVWSGLDAREWSGPVPAPGVPAATVPLDPAVSLADAASAHRQVYGTVDQHGRPAVATSAVFLPHGTPPPGGWPVIAWAHGTTGLGDGCTPSALPRSERDAAYLGHWLRQGYAVVASDYAGLGTPGLMSYLNGPTTARGVVDSVLAAHHTDLPLSPRWAIVGQSQGAGAALNTARRATELSAGSGLDYRGVVATGTPANIELIFQYAGPGFPPVPLPAGLNLYAMYILAGFRDLHPELDIDGLLTPEGRRMVDAATTQCYAELHDTLGGFQASQALARPLQSIPNVYGLLKDYMGTPDDGYDRPVFLGQGLVDTDVPAPSALSLAANMTLHRQPLELHVYPDKDHGGTVLAAIPDATAFLQRVMG